MRSLAVIAVAAAVAVLVWFLVQGDPDEVSVRPEDRVQDGVAKEERPSDSVSPVGVKPFAESRVEVSWTGYSRDATDPALRLVIHAPAVADRHESAKLLESADNDLQGAWREILARHPDLPGVHVEVGDDKGVVGRALPPGRWRAVLLEPDGRRDAFEFELAPRQVLKLERVWPPRVGLRVVAAGRVIGVDTGEPIPGARVTYIGRYAQAARPGDLSVAVDDHGRYGVAFQLIGFRPHRLVAAAAGYLPESIAVIGHDVPPDGRVSSLDFALHPVGASGSIMGRILDADGAAAADAEVRIVRPSTDPNTLSRSATRRGVRSGADGTFLFEGVPPGAVELSVSFPFHRRYRLTDVQPSPEGTDLGDLELERVFADGEPASFSGSVRNADRVPLPRVKVRVDARGLPSSASLTAFTNDDGTFQIEGVPPGDHNVRFSGLRLAVNTVRLTFGPGAAVRYDHTMPGGSHFIGGRVTEGGVPLSGVTVEYELPDRLAGDHANPLVRSAYATLVARTDATGRFRLDGLLAGDAKLSFTVDDPWRMAERVGLAVDRDDHEIAFPVSALFTVSGVVTAHGGKPVEGAVIATQAWTGRGGRARTGADGSYELRIPMSPDIYSTIRVHRRGFVPATRDVSTAQADDSRCITADFALLARASLGSVTGRARDGEGRVARGLRCTLKSGTGQPRPEWRTSTDSRGRFAFRGIPAGTYSLALVGSGWSLRRETLTLGPGEEVRHDVEVERLARSEHPVTFILEDADGHAIAGAELFVSFRSSGTTGVTDAAGRYTRGGLVAGTHVIFTKKSGYPRHILRVPISDKTPEVRLVIRRGTGVIRGRTVGTGGNVLPHRSISVRGGKISEFVTSDGDGRFSVEHLPDGTYTLDGDGDPVRTRPGGSEVDVVVR